MNQNNDYSYESLRKQKVFLDEIWSEMIANANQVNLQLIQQMRQNSNHYFLTEIEKANQLFQDRKDYYFAQYEQSIKEIEKRAQNVSTRFQNMLTESAKKQMMLQLKAAQNIWQNQIIKCRENLK